jgi:hypothetical protein
MIWYIVLLIWAFASYPAIGVLLLILGAMVWHIRRNA